MENDDEVGDLFNLVMRSKNILSLELHTLCFTGQGGVGFSRQSRITGSWHVVRNQATPFRA